MSKDIIVQPVILAGGTGTRLWPLSRESYPKQYIALETSSKFTFLQRTQLRLDGLNNLEKPIIISNESQRFIVAEQMREIKVKPKSIILEPFGRNTAPAIAISALKAIEKNSDPILLILSSDHQIKNSKVFKSAVSFGLEEAFKGNLVTLGTIPKYPSTGYGYIKAKGNYIKSKSKSLSISKFIEKPNLSTAKELIKNQNIFWNSGIFIFKASSILEEFEKFSPELLSICRETLTRSEIDYDFQRLNKKSFEKCSNISIDFAIMEKTSKGKVIPFDAEWSDIGSWDSLWESENKNSNGNVIIGDIFEKDTENCYLRSEKNLLVTLGVKDLIVVSTNDAILVSSLEKAQDIKHVVERLKNANRKEAKFHHKTFRPWGYFVSIENGSNWQIKKIVVNPLSSLSLQKHKYRSEHWIILEGYALIEIEESKTILTKNQSTYIPIGAKHRLSNPKEYPLTLIEVQSGNYLGEDDIVRFDDVYGRSQKDDFI